MEADKLQAELKTLVDKLNAVRKPGETVKLPGSVNIYERIIEICNKLKAMNVEPVGGRHTRRHHSRRGTRRH
jgi:hypothetical protein